MHPLDRPILHALKTRQSELSVGTGKALRYDQDYTPFAAAEDDGDEAIAALGALIPQDGIIVLLQRGGSPVPPGCAVESSAECVQMVLEASPAAAPDVGYPFGDADAADMLALAKLTEPGPFSTRTHRLGQFYGVREEGRLVAMAGERMKLPGYTEVSGVATHPDGRGRGYAGALIRRVVANIVGRGETPFLHAYATNAGAIRLYESLGFRLRCKSMAMMLRRD